MIHTFFRTLALSASLTAILGSTAFAQSTGTAANTVITNTVEVTFDGADPDTPITGQVQFRVDRKIDLAVTSRLAPGDEGTATPGNNQARVGFTLENRSNATLGYILQVEDVTGDLPGGLTPANPPTLTPAAGEYSIVTNTSDEFASGTARTSGENIGDLDAGGELYVWVVAHFPLGSANDDFMDFTLRAQTTEPTTDPQAGSVISADTRSEDPMDLNTVRVDTASQSTLDNNVEIDPAGDGADADRARLRVSAPVLSAQKEVRVVSEIPPEGLCNDVDNPGTGPGIPDQRAFIPGACIEYTIRVTNDEDAPENATNISISDELPENVSFVAVSGILFEGGSGGEVGIPPAEDPTGSGTIVATITTLPPGRSAFFRIRATID